jgi:hypothetical protein
MSRCQLLSIAGVVALSFTFAACGGGAPSEPAPASRGDPIAESAQPGKKEVDGNPFVDFGQEARAVEREAASKVLRENLRARANEDWSGQCSSLSAGLAKNLAERDELITGEKGGGSCAEGLELEAEPLPSSVLEDPMTGPIEALRVEGNKAHALFRGVEDKDYGMPMIKEDSEWRVSKLTTLQIAASKAGS